MARRPVVLAVLLVQVSVPAAMLAARLAQDGARATQELGASWQMYSSAPEPSYAGTRADGRRQVLPSPTIVGTGRRGPDLLCARHEMVSVTRVGGPDPGVFPC